MLQVLREKGFFDKPANRDVRFCFRDPLDPSCFCYETLIKDRFNTKLYKCFSEYLCTATFIRGSKNIMLNTADRYLSAVKNACLLAAQCQLVNLNDAAARRIRRDMAKYFFNRAIRNNEPVSEAHETASMDDFLNVTLICLWECDVFPDLQQFNYYFVTARNLAGRNIELMSLGNHNLRVKTPESAHLNMSLTDEDAIYYLSDVWRPKTHTQQNIISLPLHRDEPLLDFTINRAMYLAMADDCQQTLFPMFSKYNSVTPTNSAAKTPCLQNS
jgi:hypothetical protein